MRRTSSMEQARTGEQALPTHIVVAQGRPDGSTVHKVRSIREMAAEGRSRLYCRSDGSVIRPPRFVFTRAEHILWLARAAEGDPDAAER